MCHLLFHLLVTREPLLGLAACLGDLADALVGHLAPVVGRAIARSVYCIRPLVGVVLIADGAVSWTGPGA
ncbi:hypothetical protein GCM10010185_32920 [Saccharothrix coeruleofusca]|uniref:Uncharacterized protein n=1 Tax=Saccharothrix coeruleofusca TaxID=33919 RepID=A0A918EDJ1_9PSEU|nr:hypothetical protein GCM10010185_32920 [Saccharothrix coeruleofusca]